MVGVVVVIEQSMVDQFSSISIVAQGLQCDEVRVALEPRIIKPRRTPHLLRLARVSKVPCIYVCRHSRRPIVISNLVGIWYICGATSLLACYRYCMQSHPRREGLLLGIAFVQAKPKQAVRWKMDRYRSVHSIGEATFNVGDLW